jgi:hypothetical protein
MEVLVEAKYVVMRRYTVQLPNPWDKIKERIIPINKGKVNLTFDDKSTFEIEVDNSDLDGLFKHLWGYDFHPEKFTISTTDGEGEAVETLMQGDLE